VYIVLLLIQVHGLTSWIGSYGVIGDASAESLAYVLYSNVLQQEIRT
jgi:hypothetical protein